MQTIRTQEIAEFADRRAFYDLDPDYVTQPEGRIRMSRPVAFSLIVLRVYLLVLCGLLVYRFAQYAHWLH